MKWQNSLEEQVLHLLQETVDMLWYAVCKQLL